VPLHQHEARKVALHTLSRSSLSAPRTSRPATTPSAAFRLTASASAPDFTGGSPLLVLGAGAFDAVAVELAVLGTAVADVEPGGLTSFSRRAARAASTLAASRSSAATDAATFLPVSWWPSALSLRWTRKSWTSRSTATRSFVTVRTKRVMLLNPTRASREPVEGFEAVFPSGVRCVTRTFPPLTGGSCGRGAADAPSTTKTRARHVLSAMLQYITKGFVASQLQPLDLAGQKNKALTTPAEWKSLPHYVSCSLLHSLLKRSWRLPYQVWNQLTNLVGTDLSRAPFLERLRIRKRK
jgi:hypothetical protein